MSLNRGCPKEMVIIIVQRKSLNCVCFTMLVVSWIIYLYLWHFYVVNNQVSRRYGRCGQI